MLNPLPTAASSTLQLLIWMIRDIGLGVDYEHPELRDLVFVLDWLDDFEYWFVLAMMEKDWHSSKQEDIIQGIHYKYVKIYM